MNNLFKISILLFLIHSAFATTYANRDILKKMKTCFNEHAKKIEPSHNDAAINSTDYYKALHDMTSTIIDTSSSKERRQQTATQFFHLLENNHINAVSKQNAIDQIFKDLIIEISLGNFYAKKLAEGLLIKDAGIPNPQQSTIDHIYFNLFKNPFTLLNDYKIHNFFTNLSPEHLKQTRSAERSLFQRLNLLTDLAPHLDWTTQDLNLLVQNGWIKDATGEIWFINADQREYLRQYIDSQNVNPIQSKATIIFDEEHTITAVIVLSSQQTKTISNQFLLRLERDKKIQDLQSTSPAHSSISNSTTTVSDRGEMSTDTLSSLSNDTVDPHPLTVAERRKIFEKNQHAAETPQSYMQKRRGGR